MCKLWQRPTGSRDLEQATALAPVLLLPGPGCLVKGDLIIIILHLPERRDYRNSYGPTCSLIIYFLIVKSNLKNFFAQFYSCFRDDAHFLHGEAAYFSLRGVFMRIIVSQDSQQGAHLILVLSSYLILPSWVTGRFK